MKRDNELIPGRDVYPCDMPDSHNYIMERFHQDMRAIFGPPLPAPCDKQEDES